MGMSRAFVAFYMGDYARDTGHLSTLEHGAYFLWPMQHCWVHAEPYLLSQMHGIASLAAIVSLTFNGIKSRAILIRFFDEQGRNKRATREIEKDPDKTSIRQTPCT